MLKKLFTLIFALSLFAWPAFAQDKVNVYFFYGDGCPHCAREEKFLESLKKEIPQIDIYYFETWYNRDNSQYLAALGQALKFDVSGVPLLIVGDKVFPGYGSDATTGKKIKEAINNFLANGCRDIVYEATEELKATDQRVNFSWPRIARAETKGGECVHGCDTGDEECRHNCGCSADAKSTSMPESVNIPLFGEVSIKNLSLPVLTILIGALDGFNPCAMWVLLFLISLLLGMENRKKMWLLGLAFIFSSSLVYFLFLTAWLNLFLFFGFIFWIRIIIGLVALASGSYHLKEYWKNRDGTCQVTSSEKRKKVFDRIRQIIIMKKFWLALSGIMLLAAVVNLVELVCSAGLPAVYTQVLALANLAAWQYYVYLLLYVFIFMLDDLLVFIIAMLTLKMQAVSSRYTRWSGLVGGVIMLIIGLLLIFKPGWLMF